MSLTLAALWPSMPAWAESFEDWPYETLKSEAFRDYTDPGREAMAKVRVRADGGDVRAMLQLADYHHFRSDFAEVPIVPTEGARWLRTAAAIGDPTALMMSGVAHALGWYQLPADFKAAYDDFMAAANKDVVPAKALVGYLLERGYGVSPDPKQALSWYQEAADRGNEFAKGALGTLYEDGRGTPKDVAHAAKLYESILDSPSWGQRAAFRLGRIYERGNGVAKDEARARGYYERIRGNEEAAYRLGRMYERGLGGPRFMGRAATQYYDAIRLPAAKLALARLYLAGDTVEHSEKEALRLALDASEAGLLDAQRFAGELLGRGQDPVRGFILLAMAKEKGDVASGPVLDKLARRMKREQLAQAAGDVASTLQRQAIANPSRPVEDADGNPVRPSWYLYAMQAAEAGNRHAMAQIAMASWFSYGFKADMAAARKWSLAAYHAGEPGAGDLVARCFYDAPIADHLAELTAIAEAGSSSAQNVLGEAYDSGKRGVAMNAALAYRWSIRGARSGNSSSAIRAAIMAGYGRGVPKDPVIALEMYELAATHGAPECITDLGRLATTPQDAYAYYCIGSLASERCRKAAAEIRPSLTPAQMEASRAKVDAWFTKYGGVPDHYGRLNPTRPQL